MKLLSRIKKRVVVVLSCIALLLGAFLCTGIGDPKGHDRIDPAKGLDLVSRFYTDLLSDKNPEECSDLFDTSLEDRGAEGARKKKLAEKWKYLKDNQQLFLTKQFSESKFYSEKDFVDKARKGYWYFNPPKGESITQGWLFITLSSTLSKEQDSVWKDIAFPIVREEKTGAIKLGFYGIRINGVLLDPDGTAKRNYNLFDRLGFGDD